MARLKINRGKRRNPSNGMWCEMKSLQNKDGRVFSSIVLVITFPS